MAVGEVPWGLYAGEAFWAILYFPWVLTIVMATAGIRKDHRGVWGKEWVIVAFGLYLTAWQMVLYIFQISLNRVRSNPFSAAVTHYAFPCESILYASICVTFVAEFVLLWRLRLSYCYWCFLAVLLAFPVLFLGLSGFQSWPEACISIAVGFAITSLFMVFLRCYAMNELPFWLHCPPWTWFMCVDTWILDEKGREEISKIGTLMIN